MVNVVRWEPFREAVSLRDAMDQLFENALIGTTPRPAGESAWALALDIAETESAYVVKASLPGINPDDLEITVVDNAVTISGEVRPEEDQKDQRYHLRERRWGKFSRSVTLPMSVDAGNVQAEYQHGVLTLTLPKHEQARPHRIAIRTTNGSTIEAKPKS